MSRTMPSALKPARRRWWRAISSVWIRQASHLVRLQLAGARQRRELREFEPCQMQDAGLEPERVRREAAKRFRQA
jgi:uncharacterized protein YjiS (DUF1127 family)